MAKSSRRPHKPWSKAENQALVDAYIDMLLTELRGEPVNKSVTNRALREGPLSGRSRGSLKFKLQNISSVFQQQGLKWVEGYIPLMNKQADLEAAVKAKMGELPQEVMSQLKDQQVERPAAEYAAKDDILHEVKDRLSRTVLLQGIRSLQTRFAGLVTPSTTYEVAYAGHRYPPLELLREAAKVALGVDLGPVRGGQGTLAFRILARAGFEILAKDVNQRKDAAELDEVADSALAQGDFDAKDERDARERMMRSVAIRRGQPEFRALLIEAYDGHCAFTDCDAESALEAAHILAYRGTHTNHVQNGLLLRADMHLLFDRGLVGVNPDKLRILLSPALIRTSYSSLQDVPIRCPDDEALGPNREALEQHARIHQLFGG